MFAQIMCCTVRLSPLFFFFFFFRHQLNSLRAPSRSSCVRPTLPTAFISDGGPEGSANEPPSGQEAHFHWPKESSLQMALSTSADWILMAACREGHSSPQQRAATNHGFATVYWHDSTVALHLFRSYPAIDHGRTYTNLGCHLRLMPRTK